MSTNKVLSDFATALVSGSVKVVDLTAPLGPNTPVLYLPPQVGKNTPAVKVHEISHYDQNGPFWAWNWLELGEHTGTHFDAPVHWITGRDHKDNTIRREPHRPNDTDTLARALTGVNTPGLFVDGKPCTEPPLPL